jgi:hypothetical protein
MSKKENSMVKERRARKEQMHLQQSVDFTYSM